MTEPTSLYFGCMTQSGVTEKVALCTGKVFNNESLIDGTRVTVFFLYGNSAPFATLKVGDSDAKRILLAYNSGDPIPVGTTEDKSWRAGTFQTFVYGTDAWYLMGHDFVDLSNVVRVADIAVGPAVEEKLTTGYKYSWANIPVGNMPRTLKIKQFAVVSDETPAAFNTLTKTSADEFFGVETEMVMNIPIKATFINTAKNRAASAITSTTPLLGKFTIEVLTRLTDRVQNWGEKNTKFRIWYTEE